MLKQTVFSKQRLESQKLPWKLNVITSAKAEVCIAHTAKVLVGAMVVGVPRSAKRQTSFHHYLKCRILPDGELETGGSHPHPTPQKLQVNLPITPLRPITRLRLILLPQFLDLEPSEGISHWPSCRIPTL